jgi:hypothetical protein
VPRPGPYSEAGFRFSAAIAAPLGRRRLRLRAWARLLDVLRTANGGLSGCSRSGPVQLLADELDGDLADEIGDEAAQLVPDERLERLRRRGHEPKSMTRREVACRSRLAGRFPKV